MQSVNEKQGGGKDSKNMGMHHDGYYELLNMLSLIFQNHILCRLYPILIISIISLIKDFKVTKGNPNQLLKKKLSCLIF